MKKLLSKIPLRVRSDTSYVFPVTQWHRSTQTTAGNSLLILPLAQPYFCTGPVFQGPSGVGTLFSPTMLRSQYYHLPVRCKYCFVTRDPRDQQCSCSCPHSKEKLTFILIVGSLMPRKSVWLNIPGAIAIGIQSRCPLSRSIMCQRKENQSWVDPRTEVHGVSVSKLESHCSQSLKETSSVSPLCLVPSLVTWYWVTNRPWSW